jgi:S1-C subfamily serine protease
MHKGVVNRPYLGIAARGEQLPARVALAAQQSRGLHVIDVGPDTPARRAGLRPGDLLLAANGQAVGTVDDLQRVFVLAAAAEVQVDLWRDEARLSLAVRPELARAPLAA